MIRLLKLSIIRKSNGFKYFILASFVLFVWACEKEAPQNEPQIYKGFFVVNQGNFTAGNASLSFFNTTNQEINNNIFYQKNGVPLGDVAQSLCFANELAYIVINNSGVIWAIDPDDASIVEKISGLPSPRFICPISKQKAYVSDFQMQGLSILDLETNKIVGTVATGKTTEAMVHFENKVFVSNWSQYNQTTHNNTIQIVDVLSERVIDSIIVSKEPNSLKLDKNNKLWVLCSGGFLNEEFPALYRIHPVSHAIEKKILFPDLNSSPEQLTMNQTKDTLFFINKGVYKMSIIDDVLPSQAFIESGKRTFLSLAIDPSQGNIIVTDAGNYLQKGLVFRFRPHGTIIDSVAAGIIPGFIAFN